MHHLRSLTPVAFAPLRPAVALAVGAALLALAFLATLAQARPLHRAAWLRGVTVTEYYPVPEAWFSGARVAAPGIPGRHRIDWLYSARGLTMEGDGIGLDGRRYHVDDPGRVGWVDRRGRRSHVGDDDLFWRGGGFWRNARGRLTFPLAAGGWFAGVGRRYVRPRGITFAPGPSRPLTPYASIAVDPRLIPLGSIVYVPAYRTITPSHGWFRAQDTGGAIRGRHIDVYRPPPSSPDEGARHLTRQRIRVYPPGVRLPSGLSLKPAASTRSSKAPARSGPRVRAGAGGGMAAP